MGTTDAGNADLGGDVNAGAQVLLTAGDADVGRRVDFFLAEALPAYSRTRIKAAVVAGNVSVNGRPCKASYKLRPGDVIKAVLPPADEPTAEAEDIPLHFYYVDKHVVVVEKPAGMLTHPAGRVYVGTLVNALLYHVPPLAPVGGPSRPGIVHRLDKGTSGVLVVARSETAHRRLVEQFSQRTTGRTYLALARGALPMDEGTIEAPIGRSSHDPKLFAVSPLAAKGAVTTFRVLERFGREATLVRLRLHTGRTHQIRVHLAYLGYPVLGDATYGSASAYISRPALHAHTLSFDHPVSGERLKFLSPLAADIVEACAALTPAANRDIK